MKDITAKIQGKKPKHNSWLSQGINWFIIISLIGAYIYGIANSTVHLDENIQLIHPEKKLTRFSRYPIIYSDHNLVTGLDDYFAVREEQGWGGPFFIATQINSKGKILDIHVLEHRETPAFFLKLTQSQFFEQFKSMSVDSPFVIEEDIDGVSGATISSKAFARAIQNTSRDVAGLALNIDVPPRKIQWNINANEIILLILFLMVFTGASLKKPNLRFFTMALGLIFLGFYLNFPLSIAQVSSILLGYYPLPWENGLWWILMSQCFLMILLYGKNLYCSWLCPFGALQEFLSRISGISLKLHPILKQYGPYSGKFLTWLSLMIIFISRNPSHGSYEPFAAMFSFQGTGIIWYILPLILIISIFIRRFWCRFFCPVAVALNKGCHARNKLFTKGSIK
jgi:NosR/NirI family nitrous oxide reductase transcriptional regulator